MSDAENTYLRDQSDIHRTLEMHQRQYRDDYSKIYYLLDTEITVFRADYIARRFKGYAEIKLEHRVEHGDDKKHQVERRRPVRDYELIQTLRQPGSRILLTGDGGSGKTELTRHLAYILADEMFTHGSIRLFPVRIEFRKLQDSGYHSTRWQCLLSSLRQLSDNLTFKINGKPIFDILAENSQLVLIIDGIDEANGSVEAQFFADQLKEALSVFECSLRKCSILLTGRTEGVLPTISGLSKKTVQLPAPSPFVQR